jgi:hypothetical protein
MQQETKKKETQRKECRREREKHADRKKEKGA